MGGSEGVNERSGRRSQLPVFQKRDVGEHDVQGKSVFLKYGIVFKYRIVPRQIWELFLPMQNAQ